MTRKLKEEDFEVMRGPFEYGRQRPEALSGVLILSIFLQALLFALEYFMAGRHTVYPYNDQILLIHFVVTVILSVLSLIYAMPIVYKKSEKMQYLLSILVSQNLFSISFLISALFIIGYDGEGKVANAESLIQFTYIVLGIGFLIFVATFIRFYILLRKGHYRKGSKKDALRSRFETTSYVPTAIIGSLGLVFIIQYIVRTSAINDLNMMILIVNGIGLFFVMLFILPEQLVILYCKFRFKSFNFNERDNLNK
ncbi:hypothetical protein [Psychrobacillus vulpis]|uniref:ABC transporter ATPase n=1 Tax=Psychrobacillus vulpis TaxID=2325572 RepID=A0A544TV21_9BACI|nr:hypothetical protein [Psychrobacillus vulpis]TQR21294.1 hypothetical protein FG384_03565 [Psychrobacillus vulpis]